MCTLKSSVDAQWVFENRWGSSDSEPEDVGVGWSWRLSTPAAAAAKSLQLCPTLCDPIDGSPRGSPVPGILHARTLEWVAISFSNTWKWKVKSESEVATSWSTLHDPMDCSLPGSLVHGIFQARVLEWVAIAFSTSTPGRLSNEKGNESDHWVTA